MTEQRPQNINAVAFVLPPENPLSGLVPTEQTSSENTGGINTDHIKLINQSPDREKHDELKNFLLEKHQSLSPEDRLGLKDVLLSYVPMVFPASNEIKPLMSVDQVKMHLKTTPYSQIVVDVISHLRRGALNPGIKATTRPLSQMAQLRNLLEEIEAQVSE